MNEKIYVEASSIEANYVPSKVEDEDDADKELLQLERELKMKRENINRIKHAIIHNEMKIGTPTVSKGRNKDDGNDASVSCCVDESIQYRAVETRRSSSTEKNKALPSDQLQLSSNMMDSTTEKGIR